MADNFCSRMRGLMGRDQIGETEGLLLAPCNAVHMMFMRFPIDVLFLNRDFIVIEILHNLKPWRISHIVRGSYQAVELMAGVAKNKGVKIHDKLTLLKVNKKV